MLLLGGAVPLKDEVLSADGVAVLLQWLRLTVLLNVLVLNRAVHCRARELSSEASCEQTVHASRAATCAEL